MIRQTSTRSPLRRKMPKDHKNGGRKKLRPLAEAEPLVPGTRLTERKWKFVTAYMGECCGNTSMAYRAAFPTEGLEGSEICARANQLLGQPQVQEALAHSLAILRDDERWARLSLIDVAGSNMANFVSVHNDGTVTLDFSKAMDNGALSQIRELTQESHTKYGLDGEPELVVTTKVKLYDRTPALIALLKLYGALKEHVDHSGTVNLRPMSFDGDKNIADTEPVITPALFALESNESDV